MTACYPSDEYDIVTDWAGDGDFSQVGDTVTDHLLASTPITYAYGRDTARVLSPTGPGSAAFDLHNVDRLYSPENTDSPLFGLVAPGRVTQIERTERVNLVLNPSFENDVTTWSSGQASLVRNTGQFLFGAASMRVQITTTAQTPSVISEAVPVKPRHSYAVSAYDRLGMAGSRLVGVKPIFHRADGSIALNPSTTFTSGSAGAWTRRSAIVVAPIDAVDLVVVVAYSTSDAVVGDLHDIDGVMVEEAAVVGTYFDGDSSGAFWRGPAGNSASVMGSPLWTGRIDDFQLGADFTGRIARLTAVNGVLDKQIQTPLYESVRSGTVINAILDAVGWPADMRDVDPGASIFRHWWLEGVEAQQALIDVINSEGPPALAYVAPGNVFTYRDRHHRLLRTRSSTSQARYWQPDFDCHTPPVTGMGFSYTAPFSYNHGWRDIVNEVIFDVEWRKPGAIATVWTYDGSVALAAGERRYFTAKFDEPTLIPDPDQQQVVFWNDTIAPNASYQVTELNGQSMTFWVQDGASETIYDLRIVGRPLPAARTDIVKQSDADSIRLNGTKSYPNEAPWANFYDAIALTDLALAYYAKRRPTVAMRVVNCDDAHTAEINARTVSDRITIANDELRLDTDFHVERLEHTVTRLGIVHAAVMYCEMAPGELSPGAVPFTFDVAGRGFDDGVFDVSGGIGDFSSVFIFDHPTQGQFNFGRFGY